MKTKIIVFLLLLMFVSTASAVYVEPFPDRFDVLRANEIISKNALIVNTDQNIITEYDWLKSSDRDGEMGALSVTNRRALVLSAGLYSITSTLTLDVNYVDIASVTGNPHDTIISRSTGGSAITQEANDVSISGLTIKNVGTAVGDHGLVCSADDPSTSHYRELHIEATASKTCYSVYGTTDIAGTWESVSGGRHLFYTAASIDISGTFRSCTSSSDGLFTVGSGGALSGTFENCTGEDNSFFGGELSGTFRYCKAANDSFNNGTLSGTFENCDANDYCFGGASTGAGDECSGTFKFCSAGDNSFAYQNAFSGTAYYCIGGAACFGGYSGAGSNYGSFTGEAIGCVTTGRGFGGGVSSTGCSGTLRRCVNTGMTVAFKALSGAVIEGCRFEASGEDIEGILVSTDATPIKVYNSVIICTGESFKGPSAAARNVRVAHCRMDKPMNSAITNLVETPYNQVDGVDDLILTGTVQAEHFYSTDDANIADTLVVDTDTLVVDAVNHRVGIGTSSPNSVFHIKANIPGTVGSHPAGQIIIQNPADSVVSNVVITAYESDGNGNPDQQLWYLGSASISNSDITFLNRRNAELNLGTNGVSRVTILGNGNVGIGEAAPQDKLEVNGTALFKGAVKYTQDDGNEFISGAVADGYMDYGATTGHRFDNNVNVTGNVEVLGVVTPTTDVMYPVKTAVKTIDVNDDDASDDFRFDNDVADQAEQSVDLGAIIPAYAEVVSVQLRCFETVTSSGAMSIDLGTASGGAELLAAANIDTANDIDGTATGVGPKLEAANAAKNVWINATPGANWDTLSEGRWAVMVTYIDYGAVYTWKNP